MVWNSRRIKRRTRVEIEAIRKSCIAASEVLEAIGEAVKPGISTKELDEISREAIEKTGGTSSFLGYKIPGHPPYPATICASINEVVIHGIPDDKILLKDGDIVTIDVAVLLDGYHGDNAYTLPVGEITPEAQRLLDVAEAALYKSIEQAKPGNHLGDVCHAIEKHANSHGYSVVRDFVGHGIGKKMHESPQIPNYGEPGEGPRLKPGMIFAIEAMVNMGSSEVDVLNDGWTVVTADRKLSAHFEHTIAILPDGPEILTTWRPLD